MSVHVKVFLAVLVLGVTGIGGYRLLQPWLAERAQRATSDAAGMRGTLRVGSDSWVGYFPLCSPDMAQRMRAQGWLLRCEDDQADVPARLRKLADGELDLAVASVDSWLLSGAALDFPGAIIAVIDQSQGGDAMVARTEAVADLEALKARPQTRIAYTPGSPSEHLLKSVGVHFGLPQLAERDGRWRVPAQGSADALKRLQAGEAEVAVLWEPDLSRALSQPGIVKLIGSEDTEGLIVDVLIASRRLLQADPETLQLLLTHYFATLAHYQAEPAQLRRDLASASQLEPAQVDTLLQGVAWAGLDDNGAHWFGIAPNGVAAPEGLARAIEDTAAILVAAGDFPASPLPGGDPYRLTNRQFVAGLYLPQIGDASRSEDFAALDDAGWDALRPVGTLKLEAVNFQRGASTLDEDGRRALDAIAERLRHYPRYRLLIRGHTGTGGDAQANLALSAERSRAALDYLLNQHQLDADRLRAVGLGGSQPLAKLEGESDRTWQYRLPRVEFQMLAQR